MFNTNSVAAGQFNGAEEAEQASSASKSANARQRVDIQQVQNIRLIWLDSNIDNNNADCQNTITQLRRVVNDINTYTNGDQCIQFINTITDNKVCMIISGTLGQHIVARVHNMSQVDSIFISCGNKRWHDQWANEWPKIKGVSAEISLICEALKQVAQQCEKNAVPISFVATNAGEASSNTLDRVDLSFMCIQILKKILLTIKFEQNHIQEFINYCHDIFVHNEKELAYAEQLKQIYDEKTTIWWYTSEEFLYLMLNLTLRLMDADIIVRMDFFIDDLHHHIEQLHSEQYGDQSTSEKFTVYRGQGLSKEHSEQLTEIQGGLISFNNFLSTSRNHHVSLHLAHKAATNPDLVGILFIMKIDPSQSTTSFASIRDVSYFQGENEVLFSMHTVFRINAIKLMSGKNRFYELHLTLTNDNDQDLRTLTDRIREERFPDKGWYRLGLMLLKVGQSDKAQEVYGVLLGQTINDSENAPIYHQLGRVEYEQGDYQEAIIFYEKALEIKQPSLPPNHRDLGASYNNIGLVYEVMGRTTQKHVLVMNVL